MISKNKDWVIIFNGEIYNYKNLKEIEEKKNYWRSNSDSRSSSRVHISVWFYNAIKKLNGMLHSCILYIKKDIWLARDRFGEKPLYYNYDTTYGFTLLQNLEHFLFS